MPDPKHPSYSLEMRAFAPWHQFGGGYDGDKRGFSLAADSSSRIHAATQVDPHGGTASKLQVYSDLTKGPEFLVGAAGEGRSQSTGNVQPSPVPDGCRYTLQMAGSNPLVKGSPDIDVHADVTITQPTPGVIKISATLSGDKFPASELAIRDPAGHPVFLGGYMPNTTAPGPADFAKLVGDSMRPTSKVEVTVMVDANGNFGKLLSYQFTGPNRSIQGQFNASNTLSTDGFNRTIMQALTPDKMPAPTLPSKTQELGTSGGPKPQLSTPTDATASPSKPGLDR